MIHVSRPSAAPAAFRARLRLLVVLTVVAAALTLLQRTTLSPLPHSADGALAGLALALLSGTLVGWQVARD